MISVSTEERFVDVAVSAEQRTLNPPTVSTLEGRVTPPTLTVPTAPVIEVRLESTAPIQNLVFVHEQTIPLTEWSIPHALGVRPASIQVEVGGIPVIPDVIELSEVRVVLAFGEASTGLVTLLKGK